MNTTRNQPFGHHNPIGKPGTSRINIQRSRMRKRKSMLHTAGHAGHRLIRGSSGHQNHVYIIQGNFWILRLEIFNSLDTQIAGELVWAHVIPRFDARSGNNPFIGCFNERFEIGVVDDFFGDSHSNGG
jgi:hypothetical protein